MKDRTNVCTHARRFNFNSIISKKENKKTEFSKISLFFCVERTEVQLVQIKVNLVKEV
jgi:hypothetical protein